MAQAKRLEDSFIHLGLGATTIPLPPFDGMEWYSRYSAEFAKDGAEGRLVSVYTFSEGWATWEMHPKGSELVYCMEGAMQLTQEFPSGERETIPVNAGEYAVNPPGVWHIADVEEFARVLFITAGEGTQMRSRADFPLD